MQFVFLDDQEGIKPEKELFYAVPRVKRWEDLLAEWEPDIRSLSSERGNLALYHGEIRPDFQGKIFWSNHIEVGSNKKAIKLLIHRYGIYLKELEQVKELALGSDISYMWELIVPKQAIAWIRPADELVSLEFEYGREGRRLIMQRAYGNYDPRPYDEILTRRYELRDQIERIRNGVAC